MHLGAEYLLVNEEEQAKLVAGEDVLYKKIVGKKVLFPARSFMLVMTAQVVRLPHDLTAFVQGLSSMGRMGLLIQNDGWVDPGFDGNLTLAFYNANRIPVELRSGCRICQLVLARLDIPAAAPYHGKYQGFHGIVGSRTEGRPDGAQGGSPAGQ
jgi:dCTP deaminase